MQLFTTKIDIFHMIPFNSLSITLLIIFFSFIVIAILSFWLIFAGGARNIFGSNRPDHNANQTLSGKSKKPQDPIKIVALGCTGAGKSTFLVVMFHQWLIAGEECFFLNTNNADRNQLISDYDKLRKGEVPKVTLGGEEKEWSFVGYTTWGGSDNEMVSITCLDYPGENLEKIFEKQDANPSDDRYRPADLEARLKDADVLLGILDGDAVLKLMNNEDVGNFYRDLRNIIYIMAHRKDKKQPAHFILTKWDVLEGKYELDQVLAKLGSLEEIQRFVDGSRWHSQLRLIPVSAFGRGFAKFDRATGGMKKADKDKNIGSGLDREDDPDSHKRVKLDQSGNSVKSLEQLDPPHETHYQNIKPYQIRVSLACALLDLFVHKIKKHRLVSLLRIFKNIDIAIKIGFIIKLLETKLLEIELLEITYKLMEQNNDAREQTIEQRIKAIRNSNQSSRKKAREYTILQLLKLVKDSECRSLIPTVLPRRNKRGPQR